MTIDALRRCLIFILLCLAQALVFNRIHLFHCATPLIYVYLVVIFPQSMSRWAALLWSFAMGLSVDMFANTPGLAAASMTLLGMIQPLLLRLFLPRDAEDDIPTSMKALGVGKFISLAGILVLIYCVVFFTIEAFTFANWSSWLQCIGGSMLLTLLLVITLESIRKK